jgi:hypothetical protein
VARQQDRLEQIREGRERAEAERRRLLERMRDRSPKPQRATVVSAPRAAEPGGSGRLHDLDIEAALTAAGRLSFMTLTTQVGPRRPLNRPTVQLLALFLGSLRDSRSAGVLQWPVGPRDVSLLHPLAVLAILGAPTPRSENKWLWCEAAPDFRTLYYPWRGGSTCASQHGMLVDRHKILEQNGYHLARQVLGKPEASVELGQLHLTIGHLDRLSRSDSVRPHLAHPSLSEIYPAFSAEEGEDAPPEFSRTERELFGRVRYGAALDQLRDYRAELCRPAVAPFALFGVSAGADVHRALSHPALASSPGRVGRSPDICLLDLGPPALARLGPGWEQRVDAFLAEAGRHFPGLPVLAVTQDSFVHRRLTTRIGDAPKRAAHVLHRFRSAVVLRATEGPIDAEPTMRELSPLRARFCSTAGPGASALEALSAAARSASDPALAGALRRSKGSLRRALALPCGLGIAYRSLCEDLGQEAAEAFLHSRSAATVLAPIRSALDAGVAGAEQVWLREAEDAVRRAYEALESETPIGLLLIELIGAIVRKSSRSLAVLGSEIDASLARRKLASDDEFGRAFRRRLDAGHVRLLAFEQLGAALTEIEASREKNTWKRLILVSPSLDRLSKTLARAWLPEQLIVACDRDFAGRVSAAYRPLSAHPDLAGTAGIGRRLAHVADVARSEAGARGVPELNLDLEPLDSMQAPEDIVDLFDEDEGDEQEMIVLTLRSGRRLRARPGTVVVRHHRGAEVNPFDRALAREIAVGDAIVIPDRAFLDEARRLLPVRVLAREWVNVYHSAIEAALPGISGEGLSAKARTVLAAIRARGARTASQAAVQDWLRISEHRALPPERLRPHAPQRRREFDAFMAVINVPSPLAEKIWSEGIQPLRIDRRRAGLRMAQAFVSVLVDPHGAAAGFDPEVRARIGTLRDRALDHLDGVVRREMIEIRAEELA